MNAIKDLIWTYSRYKYIATKNKIKRLIEIIKKQIFIYRINKRNKKLGY